MKTLMKAMWVLGPLSIVVVLGTLLSLHHSVINRARGTMTKNVEVLSRNSDTEQAGVSAEKKPVMVKSTKGDKVSPPQPAFCGGNKGVRCPKGLDCVDFEQTGLGGKPNGCCDLGGACIREPEMNRLLQGSDGGAFGCIVGRGDTCPNPWYCFAADPECTAPGCYGWCGRSGNLEEPAEPPEGDDTVEKLWHRPKSTSRPTPPNMTNKVRVLCGGIRGETCPESVSECDYLGEDPRTRDRQGVCGPSGFSKYRDGQEGDGCNEEWGCAQGLHCVFVYVGRRPSATGMCKARPLRYDN